MILDAIVEKRKEQLAREKSLISETEMKKRAQEVVRPTLDFKKALTAGSPSVIAEVKKASPSKGLICADFHPVSIAQAYEKAGANALSVLTEEYYFQGSTGYLKAIREAVDLPILRKDFIIDPYSIYEARLAGADAVLLIAALLDTQRLKEYQALAQSLGLACLAEVHNEEELESVLAAGCEIVGINNRNLKTFEVTLKTTEELAKKAPPGKVLVSESGIQEKNDMHFVKNSGAHAVLIGETLMRSGDIEKTLHALRGDV